MSWRPTPDPCRPQKVHTTSPISKERPSPEGEGIHAGNMRSVGEVAISRAVSGIGAEFGASHKVNSALIFRLSSSDAMDLVLISVPLPLPRGKAHI